MNENSFPWTNETMKRIFVCFRLKEFTPPWTPSSPKLHFQVLEEQQIGTILTKLQATDADSNIDEYKLEPNDYFQVNPTTGRNDSD